MVLEQPYVLQALAVLAGAISDGVCLSELSAGGVRVVGQPEMYTLPDTHNTAQFLHPPLALTVIDPDHQCIPGESSEKGGREGGSLQGFVNPGTSPLALFM